MSHTETITSHTANLLWWFERILPFIEPFRKRLLSQSHDERNTPAGRKASPLRPIQSNILAFWLSQAARRGLKQGTCGSPALATSSPSRKAFARECRAGAHHLIQVPKQNAVKQVSEQQTYAQCTYFRAHHLCCRTVLSLSCSL